MGKTVTAKAKPTSASELRKAFTDFFAEREHKEVASAGLVPPDPTIMFTVAGMVPFKQYFLGLETPQYKRAVSVQKCLRAGGKHNDLEEIGRTSRHLSFFEMLGNFSFGDYFKEDAIIWAWEFSTKVLGFLREDIWVTVHISDDEAEKLWLEKTDVVPEQIQKLDEPNYWKMADTGPCGPCSELYLDRGEEYGKGGGPAIGGHDRFVEFWNLVFMQFEQKEDGSQVELPNPSIDTGAGLERLLALMAGADSVFDVGDLAILIEEVKSMVASAKNKEASTEISQRILVEHSRAAAFLILDGIVPSNEDRGYVLRRLVRRAIRHAQLLEIYSTHKNAVLPLAKKAIELAKDDHPKLAENADKILSILENEESRFLKTLSAGQELLEKEIAQIASQSSKSKVLSGKAIFTLHDTYGFPYDLTEEIAKDEGFELDRQGFEKEMEAQRERARQDHSSKSKEGKGVGVQVEYLKELTGLPKTEFLGNANYNVEGKVLAVLSDGVVLDKTSFYAEAGGQVGDIGRLSKLNSKNDDNPKKSIDVIDTQYGAPEVVFHKTDDSPAFEVGDEVLAEIDGGRRDSTRKHHTATHIIHWALKQILGDHISPQGSLVEPTRLRFDFSHFQALTQEEIAAIEDLCNEEILSNQPVRHFETSRAEADALGAIGFFEEKYGEVVKVLEAGKNSIELCGGTHVKALGDIGLVKIISESSIGSNIRRIEAVCGKAAVQLLREREAEIREAAELLGVPSSDLTVGAKKRTEENKRLSQELGNLKSGQAMSQLDDMAKAAEENIVVARVEGADIDTLRKMAVALRDKKQINIAILGADTESGGASLVAAVNVEAVGSLTAGELLGEAAKLISGGGGKGTDLAVAGGKDASGLDEALELAKKIALEKIGK